MLKKLIGLSFVFFIGIYYIPIYWEQRAVEAPQSNAQTLETLAFSKSSQNQILPVRGFEHYIGKPTADFIERYGAADHIGQNDDGSQWWVYQESEDQYKQIEVKDNHIQSLFVLGEGVNTGPFRVRMTRDNIYDEVELSRHFNFKYQGLTYYLSLSNQEWQDFPLVQFENNSFVILLFHPRSEEVYGLRYVSYESLLKLNILNIWTEEDEILDFYLPTSTSKQSEAEKEAQLTYFINYMRQQENLSTLDAPPELETLTQEMIEKRDINDLTFAEDVQEGVIFVSGEYVYDPPMLFSQMLINPAFQERLYRDDVRYITIEVQENDVLVALFSDEELEVLQNDY